MQKSANQGKILFFYAAAAAFLIGYSPLSACAEPGIGLVYAAAGSPSASDRPASGSAVSKSAAASAAPETEVKSAEPESEPEHSTVHKVLLYLPNRIFDIFDLFRARILVGPGLGAGVRVTKIAQLQLGSSAAVYAGFPGPRQKPTIPLPVGLELSSKAAVSVADLSNDGPLSPNYSPTEIGGGFMLLVFGCDIGFDPVEFVDLLGGIVGFDPREDDL